MNHLLADVNNPVISSSVGGSQAAGQGALQKYLGNFIALGFGIGAAAFLFMLIMGGINYITAGGDKEAVARATKRITNALIGIVILFSIYMIIKILSSLFGINVLNFTIPTLS